MSTARNTTTTTDRTRRSGRAGLVLAALVAVVATAFLAQAALAGPPPPSVPDGLPPQDGSKPYLIGHGVGVQNCACDGVAWNFVVPRADLLDYNGNLIIHHFGGPSWQAKDGSTVVGAVVAKATVDRSAIP